MTVRFDPPYQRGVDFAKVAEDIDREIAVFSAWFEKEKGQAPLTTYERGILRTYLIFVAQRDG